MTAPLKPQLFILYTLSPIIMEVEHGGLKITLVSKGAISTSMIMGGRVYSMTQTVSAPLSFNQKIKPNLVSLEEKYPRIVIVCYNNVTFLNLKQSKEGEVKERWVLPNRFTLSDVIRFKLNFADLLEKGDYSSSLPVRLHPGKLTWMITQNDGLEKVTPFQNGNFGYLC